MKVPKVNQCCCGSSLEAGATAIAWVELVLACVALPTIILDLATSVFVINKVEFQITAIFIFITGIIQFSSPIILLIGIIKKFPRFVLTWIILTSIELVIGFIIYIVNIILFVLNSQILGSVIVFLLLLFITAVYLYLIVVVINYRILLISQIQGNQIIQFENLTQEEI